MWSRKMDGARLIGICSDPKRPLVGSTLSACSGFDGGSGGSTGDLWPVIDHEFRPATLHIRRGPGEADRLSARIGHQTQREQIRETEGSFDLEPVVGFQPD